MMKRNTLLKTAATTAAMGLLLTACGGNGGEAKGDAATYEAAIAQYVSHPSSDAHAQGIPGAFDAADVDAEVDAQNAQADQATTTNIVGRCSVDVDIVLPVAAPIAIAAATTVEDTPIVFSSGTDPVDAGLVPDWDTAGDNITGVSDMNPVDDQLKLILDVVDDVQVIGIPYSS